MAKRKSKVKKPEENVVEEKCENTTSHMGRWSSGKLAKGSTANVHASPIVGELCCINEKEELVTVSNEAHFGKSMKTVTIACKLMEIGEQVVDDVFFARGFSTYVLIVKSTSRTSIHAVDAKDASHVLWTSDLLSKGPDIFVNIIANEQYGVAIMAWTDPAKGGAAICFNMSDGSECHTIELPSNKSLIYDSAAPERIYAKMFHVRKAKNELVTLYPIRDGPGTERCTQVRVSFYSLASGLPLGGLVVDMGPEKVTNWPSTLGSNIFHFRNSELFVFYCWDRMTPTIIDLETKQLHPLQLMDEDEKACNTASIKSFDLNNSFAAMGLEWQRYLKKFVLKVFDMETGNCIQRLVKGGTPTNIKFHPRWETLLFSSASHESKVRAWDVLTGSMMYAIALEPKCKTMDICLSEKYLAVLYNLGGQTKLMVLKDDEEKHDSKEENNNQLEVKTSAEVTSNADTTEGFETGPRRSKRQRSAR